MALTLDKACHSVVGVLGTLASSWERGYSQPSNFVDAAARARWSRRRSCSTSPTADHYGAPAPKVNGISLDGDIRHASCTISGWKAALGWTPQVTVEEGVRRLCDWIDGCDRG